MQAALRVFDEAVRDTSDVVTVPAIVMEYLAYLQGRVDAGTFAADNLRNIRRELNAFAGAFDQAVDQCRQRDLLRWLEANPQWKSGHSKRHAIASVIACFNWAVDEEGGGLIDKSPYRKPKIRSSTPCEPRRPATRHEYVILMKGGSRPLRRALFMLRRSGIRTCELRELRWHEVLLDDETPHLNLANHKTRRRTGRARKVGLDPGTVGFLRSLQRHAGGGLFGKDDSHVFLNGDGLPWKCRGFAQHFRRWAERLGLDDDADKRVSAYCLRHSYACGAVEAGISTRAIADQLGHTTTILIDRVYGCHTRDRQRHLSRVASEIVQRRKRA